MFKASSRMVAPSLAAFLCLLVSGCMVAGERRATGPEGSGAPVLRLHMGVAGVSALGKTNQIQLDRLEITFTSTVNDTVRDTVTTTTNPALDSSTGSAQTISKNYNLAALRTWKLVAVTRDLLDSVVHRDSAFIPALYAGDTADVSLNLAARYAMYEAKFLSIPDSVASADPLQPKQVLHLNRLVLKVDGVVVRDTTATPGPYFTPGATHTLAFDYVSAGTGTWRAAASGTTRALYAIHFPTPDTGYAVGDTVALKTVDGGATWSNWTGSAPRGVRSVSFANGSRGITGGDSTYVGVTANAGSSWAFSKRSNFSTGSTSVFMVNADTAYSASNSSTNIGSTSFHRSVDGGASWGGPLFSAGNNVYGMHFSSSTTGWVVGYGGTIRKTTTAAAVWNAQTSGTTKALRGVHFYDLDLGWVVGDTGVILKTTNGGTTWSSLSSGTTQNLRAVRFLDTAIGYAVGQNGTIIATVDGGATWSPQTSGTVEHLNGLYFSGATGFAVGNGGTLIKMNDVRSVEMMAYGPFGSWNVSNPLFSGVRYINVASGLDATVALTLRWRGPTTGTGALNAQIGKVGKVTVNGNLPDDVVP